MRFVAAIFPLLSWTVPGVLGVPPSTTTSTFTPNPTVCGDIVQGRSTRSFFYYLLGACVNNSEDSLHQSRLLFNATKVYDCLISVPFNPAVGSRLIKYINDTIQFQSTLAYLAHPPPTYQQPAVDLLAGLTELHHRVDQGLFANEYEFEVALNGLVSSAHDGHLNLNGGVLENFIFAAPVDIVSVSLDGLELPKVYVAHDLLLNQSYPNLCTGPNENEPPSCWEPSPIVSINGQDVVDYLTEFAITNSFGNLEPHSDWNMLMRSAALDNQGYLEVFAAASVYPGDTMAITFENQTVTPPLPWISLYYTQLDTGPLETGGDFYNFFVLGWYPDSYDPYNTTDDTTATGTPSSSIVSLPISTPGPSDVPSPEDTAPYPPLVDIAMEPSSEFDGMSLRGYFLNQSSLAVLVIPSFTYYGESAESFSNAVKAFIQRSRRAGLRKVVIDVQQNAGGETLLAIETFKLFFPVDEPFAGSRRRAHPMADALGSTITDYWNNLDLVSDNYTWLSTDEWVVTDRIDAESGDNFTSWQEYFGPASTYHSDNFTKVEQFNLTSDIFDLEALGTVVDGWQTPQAAFAAEDIIILSDGLCSSACALFMEMMHHDAGVRTVVAGGRPSHGPMQSPAGTRGASGYSNDQLDNDIALAKEQDPSLGSRLPDRTLDYYISYASVNLRDQVRQDDTERTPLQFLYQPADCRIFYTPQTWYNFTNLWNYAAEATWQNPALCALSPSDGTVDGNHAASDSSVDIDDPFNDILGAVTGIRSPQGIPCTSEIDCKGGAATFYCREAKGCKQGKPQWFRQCLRECSSSMRPGNCNCRVQRKNSNVVDYERLYNIGYCLPRLDACTVKSYHAWP
ncbi:Interphotoreceptor retinol-binding [Penicillium expansum]|nr:Interphotoreceptor retinol-binding [Penicillium expansum]